MDDKRNWPKVPFDDVVRLNTHHIVNPDAGLEPLSHG